MADELANKGATNGGLETLRQLHADCNKMSAYWDGSFKTNGGGGCGWIMFGSNELRGEEGYQEWQPILPWHSGEVRADVKNNIAAFMETCPFVTMLVCFENTEFNVEVETFPLLLEVFSERWELST